ncbi:response regulator [Bacillus sp. FJAT-50079]|uniref:response regulator n=1 Tax=Bacillus sp. FJAT-50079 TaxID=2833577 RepID=UPI001BCA2DCA|nr:response regulator [Bacillus sp. FJAT-50079]MBS4210464.1 response regulator [Bacillus sp. FJAT-50079]
MIRAIIVDDEELSLISLKKKLQAFPNIQVVKSYTNQNQILDDLKMETIDVAFLDIHMMELNGLELAEAIHSIQSSIHIVFVTAHSEYALQAFEVDSIDYLLKPVTSRRLQKTMHRLAKLMEKSPAPIPEGPLTKPLVVNCFGEFQVFHDRQLLHFKTAKVKELFAFLLMHLNHYIHRDIIIESLWPEQEYKRAKINLHTCLSHLRKTLNNIGYENCITFSNQSYSLSLDPIDCDVITFDVAQQKLIMLDEANIDLAIETIQRYKGPYMAINNYDWAFNITQEYEDKTIELLDKVIQYFLLIDQTKALYYLQFQRKLAPYLDENIRLSLQLLLQQGKRTEAIKLYQEYKNMLRADLGIEPNLDLTKLYDEIF